MAKVLATEWKAKIEAISTSIVRISKYDWYINGSVAKKILIYTEYKGSQFTLEQIEQRAKEKGLTLQEYLSANPEITEVAQEKPIEEVKTTPVAKDATAGEEIASDTESQSEIISLYIVA